MLKGERVSLRPMKESDLEYFVEMLNTMETKGDYLPLNIVNLVDVKKKFSETGMMEADQGRFLIVENGTDRAVGHVGFFKGSHYANGYELGYGMFFNDDRGKGYCAEAVRIATKWLFETKEINRLQICMDIENMGSKKVAEKCGYFYEGMHRGSIFSRGTYRDLYTYGMTRADFLKFCDDEFPAKMTKR